MKEELWETGSESGVLLPQNDEHDVIQQQKNIVWSYSIGAPVLSKMNNSLCMEDLRRPLDVMRPTAVMCKKSIYCWEMMDRKSVEAVEVLTVLESALTNRWQLWEASVIDASVKSVNKKLCGFECKKNWLLRSVANLEAKDGTHGHLINLANARQISKFVTLIG